jgi:integrase
MSSIRRKPSGRWEARYRDPDGQQRGKTFVTKTAAQEFLDRVGVDIRRGEYVDPNRGRVPVESVGDDWVASLVHLKPKTLLDYESALRRHVLPRLGGVAVGKVDQRRVRRFIADLLDDGVSAARVRKAVGTLKQVLDLAVEDGLIRTNPCDGIKLPRMNQQEMHFLTAEQVAVLAAAMPTQYQLLVTFAAYTGLRAGEIAALRTRHIDLDRGKVMVVTAVSEVRGRLVEQDPKSYSSKRSVSLPAFLVDALADRLDRASMSAPVFTAPGGGQLRHGNFYNRIFKPTVKATLPTDLRRARFHDLRHTHAALLIAQGAHPKAIQYRLGHSSITVTLDRYGHLFPALDDALTDGLDATYRTVDDDGDEAA